MQWPGTPNGCPAVTSGIMPAFLPRVTA